MTLEEIDQELMCLPASPTTDHDFDRRAELMAKRIQLDQAIRAASANGRPQPCGNLVVRIPDGAAISHFYGNGGRVVCSRMAEDGLVLDLFANEFRNLLLGPNGLAWQRCNPDVVRSLGQP